MTKVLMLGSMALIVTGSAILVWGVPARGDDPAVTGRVMPPAELERVAGAGTTGPCVPLSDCSRLPCRGPVGTPCMYCSGTGMDEFCACYDNTPCATVVRSCGVWMYGICGGNGKCGSGEQSPVPCPWTVCSPTP